MSIEYSGPDDDGAAAPAYGSPPLLYRAMSDNDAPVFTMDDIELMLDVVHEKLVGITHKARHPALDAFRLEMLALTKTVLTEKLRAHYRNQGMVR